MQGFLNINKAAGLTSHDVVARVRRLAGRGVKVGHAGTLDPAATGVLPVALGAATRLIEYLADARKGYWAVVALGVTTTTDDAEGEPLERHPVPPLDGAAIEQALAPFRGEIAQVPPMYAALHHQGQRLYDLARAGKTVERPARPVTIDRLALLAHTLPPSPPAAAPPAAAPLPTLTLEVACSKGTYIRALARDLGAALGCGAHLAALERTFVGPFALPDAVALADLQPSDLADHLHPPDLAVADWPAVTLSPAQSEHVRNGRAIRLTRREDEPGIPGERVRAYDGSGRLLALLRRSTAATAPASPQETAGTAAGIWQPDKVFVG